MKKSTISQVQDVLKKHEHSNSQFNCNHKKLARMYQELLDKGLASKRESQLPSITEKMAIMAKSFSQNSEYNIGFTKVL